MKKHFSNFSGRKLRRGAFTFIVSASLFAAAPAHAGGPVDDAPAATVQRSAPINGQPVFQVLLGNERKETYELRISDGAGNLLYTEQISASGYAKRFQLSLAGTEDVRVLVELVPRGNRKTESYLVEGGAGNAQQLQVSRF